MVALETVFGDFVAVLAAASATTSKPSPISTPFTALMLTAHGRCQHPGGQRPARQVRRDATGNNGDFRADGVALFFQRRISSSNASILSGSGQKNGFFQPATSL